MLYAEQPAEIQHRLEKLILPSKGPARFRSGLAYNWLDEALATAIGNGACYRQLTGHLDTAEWYNEPTIDGFSHALYLTVSQMLERGHSMVSASFCDTVVSAFYGRFPQAAREPDRLLPFYVLIADTLDMDAWHRALGRLTRARNSQTITPLDAVNLGSLRDWHGFSIIVVQNDPAATWAKVRKEFPDISALIASKKRKSIGKKGGWLVFEQGKSGRDWLLIQAGEQKDVEIALSALPWPDKRK